MEIKTVVKEKIKRTITEAWEDNNHPLHEIISPTRYEKRGRKSLRNDSKVTIPFSRVEIYKLSFIVQGSTIINTIKKLFFYYL